jgi:gliding motility-associated-like protein
MRTYTLIIVLIFVYSTIEAQTTRILADRNPVCVADTVDFRWSSGLNITITWDFGEDATPATATGTGVQRVIYSTHGVKTVLASQTIGGTPDTLRLRVSQLLPSYIDTTFTFFPSSTYILNASARINNQISIAPYRFTWTINGQDTTQTGNTSNYVYKFNSAATHPVQLRVIDAGGCEVTLNTSVTTVEMFSAPNLFTPNNDGKNDTFIIRSTGLIPFRMEIYDRWGSVVYKPNLVGTQLIWDGRNSAGTLVQPGVYFYVVTPQDSGVEPLRGFVHVFYGDK